MIAFHWLDGECDSSPTLYFDCVLDAFFLCDILFSFCLGVNDGEAYVDDWRWVATTYLKVRSRRESRPLVPCAILMRRCMNSGRLPFRPLYLHPGGLCRVGDYPVTGVLERSCWRRGACHRPVPGEDHMMSMEAGKCEGVTYIDSPKHGSFVSSGSSNRCVGSSLLAS